MKENPFPFQMDYFNYTYFSIFLRKTKTGENKKKNDTNLYSHLVNKILETGKKKKKTSKPFGSNRLLLTNPYVHLYTQNK